MKALTVLRRDQRGYTLTELLITVAILGLVMAAVLAVQMTSNTMFLRGETQAEAQQGARAAMLMEEDLRMAGYGCPDNGCPTNLGTQDYQANGTQLKITAASATSITFWADTLNVSTTLSCNPVPVPPASRTRPTIPPGRCRIVPVRRLSAVWANPPITFSLATIAAWSACGTPAGCLWASMTTICRTIPVTSAWLCITRDTSIASAATAFLLG